MFNSLRPTKRMGLALCLCLMLALVTVFSSFARPVYASGDEPVSNSDSVGEVIDDAIDSAGEAIDDAIDSAGEAIDSVGESVGEALENAKEGIESALEDAVTTGAEDEDEAAEAAQAKKIKLYTVIAAALALAVVLVVYFAFCGKTGKVTTRQLVESALMIAIGTVLSLIKIDSPFGGGVTIVSMLPLILISHRWGWRWGVVTAFVYSLIQLMLGLDNVAYATSFMMAVGIILLDYVVAYSVIGLSGIFGKSRSAVAIGIAVTFTLRFLCHLVTGAVIWDVWMPEEFWGLPMTNPWVYSAMYNGWYMAIELVVTEIVAMLIYKPLEKYIKNEI